MSGTEARLLDASLNVLAGLKVDDERTFAERSTVEQWEFARRILDPTGPRLGAVLAPRGFAKTEIVALCLVVLLLTQAPARAECLLAAIDEDQARQAHDAIETAVLRNNLQALLDVKQARITNRRTLAFARVVPADGAGRFGGKPWFTFIDEWPNMPETRSIKKFVTALISAVPKVPNARLVMAGTPSEPSHFSFRQWSHALTSPAWWTLHVFGPLPWRTESDLAEQRALLLESEFRRLHLAEWCEDEDRLSTAEDVIACVRESPEFLSPRAHERYVLGLDLSVTTDETWLAVGHLEGDRVVIDRTWRWAPTKQHPVPLAEVEQTVREASRVYNRARLVFDPFQAVGMAQRLRREGVRADQFTFTSTSVVRLASTVYRLLRDRSIELPNSAPLIEQFTHARLRSTGAGVRMDHDLGRHDDAITVCALVAVTLLDRPRRGVAQYRSWRDRQSQQSPTESGAVLV